MCLRFFVLLLLLFADDTNLFKIGCYLVDIQDELNAKLLKISTWLKCNKLSLDIGKTHFMLITDKKIGVMIWT